MSTTNPRPAPSPNRSAAIDHYRGLAILLMVLADYLSHIRRVPAWLKHAPGVGLTVVDLIAPLFIFAIGLTYGPSFRRRLVRDGGGRTVTHFLRRNLALMGIGTLTPWGYTWGLFQTIGGAGLLALPAIWLPTLARLLIGIGLLGGYQALSSTVWLGRVTAGSSWCEMEGTLGWAALLILATVLADWYDDRSRGAGKFILGSLAALGLGITLSHWIAVSQYFVSASYVLISLGASGLLFIGFHCLVEGSRTRLTLLSAWGRNPLVLYLLHYWIWVYVFVRPLARSWYTAAPTWLILLQLGGFLGVLSLAAWILDRRGWILSL